MRGRRSEAQQRDAGHGRRVVRGDRERRAVRDCLWDGGHIRPRTVKQVRRREEIRVRVVGHAGSAIRSCLSFRKRLCPKQRRNLFRHFGALSADAKIGPEEHLSPQQEDRRRLCRERKVLIAERVKHVNRIKGLLFSQGVSRYEPLSRDRRQRLDELRTGDGRPLPKHLKAQISRELDRLELLLEQIKTAEIERDALLAEQQVTPPASAAMLLDLKGIGPEFAAILWSEGLCRHFDNRRQIACFAGLAPTAKRIGRS
jgi:Transposase IS116/IS110/IS902 family